MFSSSIKGLIWTGSKIVISLISKNKHTPTISEKNPEFKKESDEWFFYVCLKISHENNFADENISQFHKT